jgi:hypothetical protein
LECWSVGKDPAKLSECPLSDARDLMKIMKQKSHEETLDHANVFFHSCTSFIALGRTINTGMDRKQGIQGLLRCLLLL